MEGLVKEAGWQGRFPRKDLGKEGGETETELGGNSRVGSRPETGTWEQGTVHYREKGRETERLPVNAPV